MQIERHMVKWKAKETSRASFVFNQSELQVLQPERDSKRLRELLKTSCECMIYICHKRADPSQALVFMDAFELLVNSSIGDLTEAKLVSGSEIDLAELLSPSYECLGGSVLVRYKLIFDCKLLYAYVVEPGSRVAEASCVKLSQKLRDVIPPLDDRLLHQLYDSQLDYLCAQLAMFHND